MKGPKKYVGPCIDCGSSDLYRGCLCRDCMNRRSRRKRGRKPYHGLQAPFMLSKDRIHADLLDGIPLIALQAKYGIKYSTISLNAKKLWGFTISRGKRKYTGPCIDCGNPELRAKTNRCRACLNRRNALARGGGQGHPSGPTSPAWKGGASLQNLRLTKEYKNWRKAVFERDNYMCLKCGKRGGVLVADHIVPFCFIRDNIPELLYYLDNGQTLCDPCHRTTSTYGEKAKRFKQTIARWAIDKYKTQYEHLKADGKKGAA